MEMFFQKLKNRKGMTIVELLVSMAVFVTAIAIITGLFVEAVRSQRQISRILSVNSDAGVMLELMAREIRTGHSFEVGGGGCGPGGVDAGNQLSFVKAKQNTTTTIAYALNQSNQDLERGEGGGTPRPLNASGVNVKKLCFLETQNLNDNSYPWRITILLTVGVGSQDVDYESRHQTTVSGRILPNEI